MIGNTEGQAQVGERKCTSDLVRAARTALPFIAYAFDKGVDGAEEAGRAIESCVNSVEAALAATGKQKVGEAIQDDRFPGGFADAIAYVNELEELAEALHENVFGYESDGESGASTILQMTLHQLNEKHEQVGEVQGDALSCLPLYRMADDANGKRGLHRDDTGSWVKIQDVERALAARQPVGDEDRAEFFRKGWESGNAAQGFDLGQLPRVIELMQGVSRTLVDWAYDDQREAINIVKALVDQRDAAPGVGNG